MCSVLVLSGLLSFVNAIKKIGPRIDPSGIPISRRTICVANQIECLSQILQHNPIRESLVNSHCSLIHH